MTTSPSRIPEAAVEAVATVFSEVPAEFAKAGAKYRASLLHQARAALEAAAPHMTICSHDDTQGEK